MRVAARTTRSLQADMQAETLNPVGNPSEALHEELKLACAR